MSNILIDTGNPMKLVRLIKMCLTETCSSVRVSKHLSDVFPIRNGLKKRRRSFPIACQFCFRTRHYESSAKPRGLEIQWLLVYAVDVNILRESVHSIKKNTEAVVVGGKEIGLEANADKTKHMVMSRDQNAGRSRSMKTDNSSFERVEQFKYM